VNAFQTVVKVPDNFEVRRTNAKDANHELYKMPTTF